MGKEFVGKGKVFELDPSMGKMTEAERVLDIGATTTINGKPYKVVDVWYRDNPKLRKPVFAEVR